MIVVWLEVLGSAQAASLVGKTKVPGPQVEVADADAAVVVIFAWFDFLLYWYP